MKNYFQRVLIFTLMAMSLTSCMPAQKYAANQEYAGEINLFFFDADDQEIKYAMTFNPAIWRLTYNNRNKLLEFIQSPQDCTLILDPSISASFHEGELPQTMWIDEKENFADWISVDGKILPECIRAIKDLQKTARIRH